MKKIGLYTGSFDPITKGHLDVIERASRLFDHLYVGVFYNEVKQGMFSEKDRLTMVTEAVAHLGNVSVLASRQRLAVEVAEELGCSHLIRGVRNGTDLAYEMNLEFFNQGLAPAIETIYFSATPAHREISSSRVRELIHFQADLTRYVPESVVKVVKQRDRL